MEEQLRGGVNEVTRIADTVHRPTGTWTPAVHALLRHLNAVGFAGAPRVHGYDDAGREVLDFLPGEVTDYPLAAYATTDAALVAVARLLREYHDATVGFVPPADARWYFPAREPAEVICHGDAAPYNCVFRAGLPVAFFDFDTAHPGPRRWDVAYTAHRFVPLTSGGPVGEQLRRLDLFCTAYGLGEADRRLLPATVVERLEAVVGHIRSRAAAGDAAFARHLAEGHTDGYEADIRHVTAFIR